jgi:two-component system phosphate regulon sensor histidine kinase PhoR
MSSSFFAIILLVAVIAFLLFRIGRMSAWTTRMLVFLEELSTGNFNARLFSGGSAQIDEIGRGVAAVLSKTKARLDFAEQEMLRMEAILRGMSDGLLIIDARDTVVLANNAFKKMLHIADQIEGRQLLEVLRNVRITDIIKKSLETREVISEEVVLSRYNEDAYLVATAVPISSHDMPAEDTPGGIVLSLHDITRLRRLEEMRKDFVANVSHEIKTPLTAIKGFAETLMEGAISDKDNAVRFLGMIKNHSERLNSLVDDLLTLSRIELGDIALDPEEINFEHVADAVLMTLKDKADRKGIYLKKEIMTDNPVIRADRNRLIQVLINLVDNGIKFTETGGVTVGIEDSQGNPALYVRDTGIGVPSAHLHRLGERFYRVDRARSRELGGTGLGLAIVKHLVNAHGWTMSIESTYGKGTTVRISAR